MAPCSGAGPSSVGGVDSDVKEGEDAESAAIRGALAQRVVAFARTASQADVCELIRKLSLATSAVGELEAANARLASANRELVSVAVASTAHAARLAADNTRLSAELATLKRRRVADDDADADADADTGGGRRKRLRPLVSSH